MRTHARTHAHACARTRTHTRNDCSRNRVLILVRMILVRICSNCGLFASSLQKLEVSVAMVAFTFSTASKRSGFYLFPTWWLCPVRSCDTKWQRQSRLKWSRDGGGGGGVVCVSGICPDDTFQSSQSFVTKRCVVMHDCEPECHYGKIGLLSVQSAKT